MFEFYHEKHELLVSKLVLVRECSCLFVVYSSFRTPPNILIVEDIKL
jgi:hypothetical protein